MIALLTRHAWIIPLFFALAFGVAGYSTLAELERNQRAQIESEVRSRLDAAVAALQIWTRENEATAVVLAQDPRISRHVSALAELSRRAEDPVSAILDSSDLRELRRVMEPISAAYGFTGWGGQNRGGMMISALLDSSIGQRPQAAADALADMLEGRVRHSPPLIWDPPDESAPRVVTMIVGVGVRDADDRIVANFGFAIDPSTEFAHLLETARPGITGETYAFNKNGVLVSPSRFEDEMRALGLLPADEPNAPAVLNVAIRAPGGDMSAGYVPELPIAARPLTKAAAAAISGEAGFDIDGYPDYRGVPVVGAWAWMPELQIGLASELDVSEAYAGLFAVRLRFAILTGLLVAGALAMLVYSVVVARLRGRVEQARQLGSYKVDRKLGQGGMGTVYLARHALLRRPTAIKVLELDVADGSSGTSDASEGVTRFEREVQVTSALSHPNTIEIYDFGEAPDGSFYYAMEFVGGLTLSDLVEAEGALPEARVLGLMRQMAGSLAEAHRAGLVHRDLKPSNIMLCERGGIYDFVKVLDFGLVRATQQSDDVGLTSTQMLTGTPLYMSPEAVENPKTLDARADVYQLGAVAYTLLTGRPPFEGKSVVDVLAKHIQERPVPPSEVIGAPLSEALERVVLRCLEKDPAARYPNAGELVRALADCPPSGAWTQDDAGAWWETWTSQHGNPLEDTVTSGGSAPSAYQIDLAGRLDRSRRGRS